MPKKETPEADVAEFDLKHRITGAAVLLFLGALVLPWLLGPPSEASKVRGSSGRGVTSAPSNTEVDIEPVVLSGNTPASDIAEKVYISKITPVDAKQNSQLLEAASKAADTSVTPNPQASKSSEVVTIKDSAQQAKDKKDTQAKDALKKAQAKKKAEQEAAEQAKRESDLQTALAAETNSGRPTKSSPQTKPITAIAANSVDVGWVVQVGLFTEKDRAIAFISELKNRGFNASSTVVDTNRGKNTGTRVWLGPFAKRASALAEQQRLKSKAGKEGFIRVYP